MEVKGNIVSGVMLFGVVLIWGMFVVQISAQPASAQTLCKLKCASNGEQIATADIPKAVVSNEDNTKHKYCVLGCAYSKCVDKSTPTDPRADEVESCINSCDETCIKN
ncbi:hypothetical protein MKW92_035358 [Papaver armeniacum]|nr:hypothetical protein MKW92_035358 [Papaver armeniacum]